MILKSHARTVQRTWIAVEAMLVAVSLHVARWLAGEPVSVPAALVMPATWVVMLAWPIALLAVGAYRTQRTTPVRTQWLDLARAHVPAAALFGTLHLSGLLTAPGTRAVGIFVLLAFLTVGVQRSVVRELRHAARRVGRNTRNVIVAGDGDLADRFISMADARHEWGLRVLGLVAASGHGTPASAGVPRLGALGDLPDLLNTMVVDEFAVCAPLDRRMQVAVQEAERRGIVVRLVAPGSRAVRDGDESAFDICVVGQTAGQELGLMTKRALDVAVAAVALVAAAPLALLVSALIRIDSTGPALFRQTRVGLHGRRFTLFKFRSMALGSEHVPPDLQRRNEVRGPAFKLRRDPRVTRVGRWLRASSLDELPQLWNVLRGDMSLVGPRPPLEGEVARYTSAQRRRLAMKPGMTGLWQVSGRSQLDFDAWVDLDLAYVDRWSLMTDLRILLRTIPAVLSGRGAW